MCLERKTYECEFVPKQFLPTSEKASWHSWRFKMKFKKKTGWGKKEKRGKKREKKVYISKEWML